MAITDSLVLPADVVMVPVVELSAEVRKQFDATDSDYALTRPRSRTPSKIIDIHAAEFLKEFSVSKTIVEAVISYSRTKQLDPEKTLEEAFPMLQQFVSSGLLVPAGSEEASHIVPCFAVGDRVASFTVQQCIQVLEDTELYQVKCDDGEEAALKILRPGCKSEMEGAFGREASILKYLDGLVNPKLRAAGAFEGRQYLAMEWCPGVSAMVAVAELRRDTSDNGRKKLLGLCCTILEAYAQLHLQKVIHSDIHPGNMLVDNNGAVKIIDFSLARIEGMTSVFGDPHRGGIGFFFEPEYAKARMKQRRPPRSSMQGEQHALAAMLYLLLTGSHYLDFSAEKEEMLRQIAQDTPRPFSQRGIPWPEVEELLAKGLSKNPSDRFPSVAEFARRLSAIDVFNERGVVAVAMQGSLLDQSAADSILNGVLRRVRPSGPLLSSGLRAAPICSVNYGASGIAYALYRIACIRGDASLLSQADCWSIKSTHNIENSSAFYNSEIEITPQTVGQIALYHSASGVHCVQGLISHAMGDIASQQAALQAFIAASKAPCENVDLTLGKSSTLIGCSLLLDAMSQNELVNIGPLLELADDVVRDIWEQMHIYAPIREGTDFSILGLAQGCTGVLYATMRWCQSAGRPLPSAVEERLRQLAECAEPRGHGYRWQIRLRKHRRERPDDYMSGWCNGSAGYVFLWTLAHKVFHDDMYFLLAQKAAWNAWEEPNNWDSLCCGLAGRAYSLLNLYKHTGENEWLYRAQDLTQRAVINTDVSGMFSDSLYKGTLGVAVLVADLLQPEEACMPLFEQERWPSTRECSPYPSEKEFIK